MAAPICHSAQAASSTPYFVVGVDFLELGAERVIKMVDLVRKCGVRELIILRFARPGFIIDETTVPTAITPSPDINVTPFVLTGPSRADLHANLGMMLSEARGYTNKEAEDVLLSFICPNALAGITCPVNGCCMAPKPNDKNVVATCMGVITGVCRTNNCQLEHGFKRSKHFGSSIFHAVNPGEWLLSPYCEEVLKHRLP